MRTIKRRVPGRLRAEINITPLIDVLLVLTVIFMVITPKTPTGLEAGVPQHSPQTGERPSSKTLILSVSSDGRILLNQDEVDAGSVASRLQDVFRTGSDRTLFVQADDDVLYNDVAHWIDVARGAGAANIGLMTQRIESH